MAEVRPPARLHVVMRSHGAENRKDRPDFYDKTVCLASLIRAAEAVDPAPEVLFVNDGPIPAARERLMLSAGEVVQGEFGSNRRSYRKTLEMAARRCRDDDLVWLAEDDYLYAPDAFVRLVEAAELLPSADYFSLYLGELVHRNAAPATEPPGWVPAVSTTSSFGVRGRQLREDLSLLRMIPYTGGAFDHTTFLALHRQYPFTRDELLEDLLPFGTVPAREWPRSLGRGVLRSVLGLRAWRRPSRRRVLVRPTSDLIAHLETGAFEPSAPWESLARRSGEWATERLVRIAQT